MSWLRRLTLTLGLNLLLWQPITWADTITTPHSQQSYDAPAVIEQLRPATVVYLGETHDSQADHNAQLQILQALYAQNPNLAVGMEMFQRPFQSALDQYLAGEISADELRQASEYDQRWGFPWEFYEPIVAFAKAHNLPVIALNTPTEVTRQVARTGLASLAPEQFEWIPPLSEISTDNEAYRELIRPIYEEIHQGRTGAGDSFEFFLQAQVLWDETMAEAIAQFVRANPERQLVVIVGQGHLVYGYGIPDRVARRLHDLPNVSQQTVLLNPIAEFNTGADEAIADWLWHTDSTDTPASPSGDRP